MKKYFKQLIARKKHEYPIMRRHFRALVYREWITHKKLLEFWFALWIIGLFVLQVFEFPFAFLIFGLAYAASVPYKIASKDILENTEGYTLTLPHTRRVIFLARFCVALVPLLLMVGIGIICIYNKIPQALWRTVIDSGFVGQYAPVDLSSELMLFTIPLWISISTFCVTLTAKNREGALKSNEHNFLRVFFVLSLIYGNGYAKAMIATSSTTVNLPTFLYYTSLVAIFLSIVDLLVGYYKFCIKKNKVVASLEHSDSKKKASSIIRVAFLLIAFFFLSNIIVGCATGFLIATNDITEVVAE